MSTLNVHVKPSAAEILGAVATPAKAKKKGSSPEFQRPELKEQTDRLVEVQSKIKALETEKAYLNATLSPVAEDLRIMASLEAGENLSSVKLNGICYIAQARFSSISNPDEIARLQAIPAVAPYLQKNIIVKVHVAKLTPEQAMVIAQLRDSGAVEVSSQIEVDPQYLADRTLKGDVAEAQKIAGLKNVAFLKA